MKKFLTATEVNPDFPILMDTDRSVVKKLLLYNKEQTFATSKSEKGSVLPNGGETVPATMIIDKSGVLKLKYLPQYYSDRPPVDYVLDFIKTLNSQQK